MNGLYSLCNIYERRSIDDGYGSVKESLVLFKQNVRCRFTQLTEQESMRIQGQGSAVLWRVSTELVSGLHRDKRYVIRRVEETT